MIFNLLKPEGRRSLWRVEIVEHGEVVGEFRCDTEEIARELLRRLKARKSPGWVAYDLRHPDGGCHAGGAR